MIKKLFCSALLLFLLIPKSASREQAATDTREFDLIIKNGRIVDGTGNPWFYADLAVKNGRIAAIGTLAAERAAHVIDARGKTVTPGFIDVHGHIEGGIASIPTADNFLQMGVTTVITGNCGSSVLDLQAWYAGLERDGVSINIGSLIGHNTVRRYAMSENANRPPTAEELERMRGLVEQAMRDGAFGLSTGLIYVPGTYAQLDEIVELAKASAKYGGLYATHMRDEGEKVEEAIKEALEVGEKAGCPVEISHFKITSKRRWGTSATTVKMVEQARARGQQVTVDQYLYTASSTNLNVRFPARIFEGGFENMVKLLQDPVTRAQIKKEVVEESVSRGYKDLSYAVVANYGPDPSFNGKSISEITRLVRKKRGIQEEAEQAIDMLLAGGAHMIYHSMSEGDLERILRQPFTMIAADSAVNNLNGSGVSHPRTFGNNARLLNVYVKKRGLIGLEEAVRKMTSLPAQAFGLWDRGLLRPGMAADIVIFDAQSVADQATFEDPKRYPTGFEYVIVNGRISVERGQHAAHKSGQILRKNLHN